MKREIRAGPGTRLLLTAFEVKNTTEDVVTVTVRRMACRETTILTYPISPAARLYWQAPTAHVIVVLPGFPIELETTGGEITKVEIEEGP